MTLALALHTPELGPCAVTPRDYQARAIRELRAEIAKGSRYVLLVAPTGCHRAGQLIMMHDGSLRAVEDVREGECLMGPDSTPRRVLRLCRGRQQMARIVPTKGESWVVNLDHVLSLVRTQDGSKHAGGIVDVTVREWLAWSHTMKHVHKLFRVPVEFAQSNVSPLMDPYFLGLYLADGSCRNTFAITKPDPEVLAVVAEQATACGMSVRTEGSVTNSTHFITSATRYGGAGRNPMLNVVGALGLRGVTSESKFVPPAYKYGSRETRLATLAGVLDGDGSLSRGGFDFISKSKQLADDVVFIARSVGLAAYVTECQKFCQTGGGGTYHRVSISGDCSMIPTRIARKQAPERRQKKDVLRVGFAVELIDEEEFYGFELDGDRRYLLGDFTVTHNSGKTVCAGLITRSAIEKGGEVLVLAHRSELLDQMYTTCERMGLPRAWLQVIRGGDRRRNPGARVHIASVDTLRNWVGTGRLPKVRVIVIDEAHRSAAAGYVKIREAYPDAIVIGLTATPWRLDGKALDTLYTSSVVVATIPELVQQGALVPVRCFTHPKGPDLSKVKTKGGDFDQEQAASVMRSRILLGSIVDEYKRRADGRAAFGFACNVAHAQELAEACSAAGIASVAIHGETPEAERKAALDGLRSGRVQILWNAALFTEGTDVPQVKCVILARPTLSKALAFQMIGRGMRPCPETGFADCVLLDHAGVLPIHGHPMEPQDYALTSAKVKASGPAQTKNCPSCGETVATGATLCACGHTWERAEREGPTVVPGKLEEIKPKEPKVMPPIVERGYIRRAFAIAARQGIEGDGARRYARGILRKQLHREPDAALFAEEAEAIAPRAPAVEVAAPEAAELAPEPAPVVVSALIETEVRF